MLDRKVYFNVGLLRRCNFRKSSLMSVFNGDTSSENLLYHWSRWLKFWKVQINPQFFKEMIQLKTYDMTFVYHYNFILFLPFDISDSPIRLWVFVIFKCCNISLIIYSRFISNNISNVDQTWKIIEIRVHVYWIHASSYKSNACIIMTKYGNI